jgi:hypothetical protein
MLTVVSDSFVSLFLNCGPRNFNECTRLVAFAGLFLIPSLPGGPPCYTWRVWSLFISVSLVFLPPILIHTSLRQSLDSDGLRARRPWQEICLFSTVSKTGSGLYSASCPVGTGCSLPGVKRPGREAGHSPLSRTEVKNGGAIPPLPHASSWRGA